MAQSGTAGGEKGGKDIKKYYVDAAEDFCQQYCPPTDEEVKSISKRPHTHVRDFKKLSVLSTFGVSKVNQQVSDIEKNFSAEVAADSSSLNNVNNDYEIPALQLRGYQLEGVNWLLWNWWNCRSYILEDETSLG